ncbi:hypothetical protein B0T24DRAFT_650200 [Lasiosphaeria ovina]|uniref:ABC transporter domain-containing protein n=1 Tax=Lasiosphaeria ovina TaxID=92902 RepID=A0AAE0N5K0_9PEZI|nr:hypothetical protein B0T24DRAFT_650200 [Lasiosphaeria ovina]
MGVFFCICHLLAAEYIPAERSKGRFSFSGNKTSPRQNDALRRMRGGKHKILNCVDGWVKPGTLTALMGVKGAGKTSLLELDVLAFRATVGVITGDVHIDGRLRDAGFQRRIGYVQQEDIHLPTATVREALNFSAIIRQGGEISTQEKLAYVDAVLDMLDMTPYADSVVGIPGEGILTPVSQAARRSGLSVP